MSTTKKVALPLRDGSIIRKMYDELKDGKVHEMKAFRAKYKKMGVSKPRYMLYRLCRILRTYTTMQINSSDRTNTVQLVSRDKAAAAREAVQKNAKKAPAKTATKKKAAKPVATKKIAKPVSKKAVVKSKPVVKPVTVAVGADDDDVIEE